MSRCFQDKRFDLKQYMLSTPRRNVQTERHTSACGCDRGRSTNNEIDTVMETRKELSRRNFRIACDWSLFIHRGERFSARMRYTGFALFFASTWNTTRWSASQRCKRWRKYLTTIDIVPKEASFPEIATLFDSRAIQRRRFGKFHVSDTLSFWVEVYPLRAFHENLDRESRLLCII